MRVFLVDSEPIFREGLKSILKSERDLTVVGESGTCTGMNGDAGNFDLMILDGQLDSIEFLNGLQKGRSKGCPPYVLVLAKNIEEQHAVQMLKAGADGFLPKSESPETVLSALRKICKGGKYVPNDVAETMIFAMNGLNGSRRLSNREYQVLHLFASGMNMTAIADHLALSVKTISTYRARLLEKLNLKSNAELMRYAFKQGMVQ